MRRPKMRSSSCKSIPTQFSIEDIALPSTSQPRTSVLSRYHRESIDRPSTTTSTTFYTIVVVAQGSNEARKQFVANTKRSTTIAARVPSRIHASRSPLRAQSIAIETSNNDSHFVDSEQTRNSIPRSQSASISDRRSSCDEKQLSMATKVLAFMFCGNFEAATNSQWLCQNKIAYIVNLTNVQRFKMRSCSCFNPKYHTPTEYTPKIDLNTSNEQILEHFKTINSFIAQARSKNIQVLLFNKNGIDLVQAVAVQYIMFYHSLPLSHALAHLTKTNMKVKISQKYLDVLHIWEEKVANAKVSNKAIEAMIRAPLPLNIDHRLAWI